MIYSLSHIVVNKKKEMKKKKNIYVIYIILVLLKRADDLQSLFKNMIQCKAIIRHNSETIVNLKKLRRAEGGAKMFGVFRVKNHDFTPKNHIFFQF